MESRHFDDLTRSIGQSGETRRAAVRLLVGGALGLLTARIGLDEAAGARKKRKRRVNQQAHANGGGKGQLQAEGKRKGKKRHKRPKTPPLPPGCQACNACQMCQDEACVPDSALEGVRCLGSGATCGYCQGGQCVAAAAPPCPDGSCPQSGQCCPGDKRCPDREHPLGFICLGADDCCPDQKRCASGCVYKQTCCEEDRPVCGQCGDICVNGQWRCSALKPCVDGSCVAPDECCPEQWECADGSCVAQDQCCPDERRCPDGACVSEGACCLGEKLCPGGDCVAQTVCCPGEAPPVCGDCQVAVCENGSWRCRPTGGSPCQDSRCPAGYYCHHLGSCCRSDPFHCTCPDGYVGCAGWCCKSCCGGSCCAEG